MNFFRNFSISSPSFWLGFLSGILSTWIISRLVIYLPKAVRSLRKNVSGVRENLSTSVDARLRNDVFSYAQKQHIASALFSLDEIAITPKVLTPLVQAAKSIESAPTDSVSITLPYTPDWPELAAIYKASTMTLLVALQGGANIILGGHPGSGKSVALAWLASSLARNDPGLGILAGYLPLYMHATEVYHLLRHVDETPDTTEEASENKNKSSEHTSTKMLPDANAAMDILIRTISTYVSPLTLPRLPGLVRSAVERNKALLILDRCDELPPNQAKAVCQYIQTLLEAYPKLRVICALSYDDLAGFPALGFSLLAMAAWGEDERNEFLNRWGQVWNKWIIKPEKNATKKINPNYLNSWLKVENTLLKPLEYTLKVWAAYAGDIIGADGTSAIEAHIRRLSLNTGVKRPNLDKFALQLIQEGSFASTPHEGGFDALSSTGILISYPGSQFGFSHPIFEAYLASNALTDTENLKSIQNQSPWVGKTLAFYYYARVGDVSPYINDFIQEDDILHTNHLNIARWLQVAPKNRQWRSIILRTLTTILQKEKDTPSLAAKIISGLAFSGDSGILVYFRQLLKSENQYLKPLAALGCGVIGEKKAIEDLVALLAEESPASIRAASLALAAIGDKQSLEILASNLLNGSELARRCAAEALANNPIEGYPALKDGSSMEDLLVRRSVAFGLIRINQPWAIKIVENMQLEDNEWVVRNSALQAFEEYRRKINYAPKPLPEPTEVEWLANYAAKIGTNVAPGKPADDLVAKALTNGTQDEQLNALDYLRMKCDVERINDIYSAYTQNTGEIKDIAYYVLWMMMVAGIKLPTSIKYNIQ